MKIVTGNNLENGRVVWWTGEGWSLLVEDAVDVGDGGDAVIAAEEAAQRVNAAYAIDAQPTANGPRPAHIKDRVRALGPTVRLDLTLKADEPGAIAAVI